MQTGRVHIAFMKIASSFREIVDALRSINPVEGNEPKKREPLLERIPGLQGPRSPQSTEKKIIFAPPKNNNHPIATDKDAKAPHKTQSVIPASSSVTMPPRRRGLSFDSTEDVQAVEKFADLCKKGSAPELSGLLKRYLAGENITHFERILAENEKSMLQIAVDSGNAQNVELLAETCLFNPQKIKVPSDASERIKKIIGENKKKYNSIVGQILRAISYTSGSDPSDPNVIAPSGKRCCDEILGGLKKFLPSNLRAALTDKPDANASELICSVFSKNMLDFQYINNLGKPEGKLGDYINEEQHCNNLKQMFKKLRFDFVDNLFDLPKEKYAEVVASFSRLQTDEKETILKRLMTDSCKLIPDELKVALLYEYDAPFSTLNDSIDARDCLSGHDSIIAKMFFDSLDEPKRRPPYDESCSAKFSTLLEMFQISSGDADEIFRAMLVPISSTDLNRCIASIERSTIPDFLKRLLYGKLSDRVNFCCKPGLLGHPNVLGSLLIGKERGKEKFFDWSFDFSRESVQEFSTVLRGIDGIKHLAVKELLLAFPAKIERAFRFAYKSGDIDYLTNLVGLLKICYPAVKELGRENQKMIYQMIHDAQKGYLFNKIHSPFNTDDYRRLNSSNPNLMRKIRGLKYSFEFDEEHQDVW
ncbi:hypothetical protein [Caballeronia calidae]|uniref:hypothetical protein n=1 Tax=Caballeronia calidae TaxID=1777139 RepID=UPI0012FD757C|nr:hypothetical protein [Caballeronia calidae]